MIASSFALIFNKQLKALLWLNNSVTWGKSPKSILNILNSPNYKKKKWLVCEPTRQTASSTTLKKKMNLYIQYWPELIFQKLKKVKNNLIV